MDTQTPPPKQTGSQKPAEWVALINKLREVPMTPVKRTEVNQLITAFEAVIS